MLWAAALAGCPDHATGDPPGLDGGHLDAGDGASHEFPIHQINVTWEPCSLYEGADDGRAECARVQMPRSWEAAAAGLGDGAPFEVVAKRLRAPGGGEAQLWMLAGGPGGSGVFDHADDMEQWQAHYPALDVYTLDHRGTGHSGYLECADQLASSSAGGASLLPNEVSDCVAALEAQWGTDLSIFSTTNAAIDVGALVEASREPGQPVFLWGGSYGTYWAQRYLQIFPRQADGVILEGIAAPDVTVLSTDEDSNRVGLDFLEVCAQDTLCASRLGSDPVAFYAEALAQADAGGCPNAPFSSAQLRQLLVYVMYSHPLNTVVPAAIYRYHRCTPTDGAALAHLYNLLFGASGAWTRLNYSIALQYHINLSEMYEHPDYEGVDLQEQFTQLSQTALFYRGLSYRKAQLRVYWTPYEDARFDDGWAQTDTPLLMLQGALDPATPLLRSASLADHFTGTHQHFVTFPTGAHGVQRGSPTTDATDVPHCGRTLILDFLHDPAAPLDTSCVDDVLPLDFAGTPALARSLLGTDDFWDDPPLPPAPAPPSPEVARALRDVRRQILRDHLFGRLRLVDAP